MTNRDLKIPTPGDLNRIVKLVIDSGDVGSIEEAEQLLRGYAAVVRVGPDALSSPAGQAALLTIVSTGKRALPGGIFVEGNIDVPLQVAMSPHRSLKRAIKALGGRIGVVAPSGVPQIYVGEAAAEPRGASIGIRCIFNGWRGGVAPLDTETIMTQSGEFALSGVLSGALAVSEVFQHLRGGFAQAGRRDVGLSLWNPERIEGWATRTADEPVLEFLPSDLWLIGLGHLGQAYLWTLGMLPYAAPQELRVVLQDYDSLDPANESTSVLTDAAMRGTLKTRAMAVWAEARGFQTTLIERKFGADFRVQDGEPVLALCGVDNPGARAALEQVGFKWIVDAGLGAGVSEFLAMRIYSFPGPRIASEIWGAGRRSPRALPLNQKAYQALREAGLDECGLTLLAERTVGAPFVGVTTATLVISEVLRGLHGGKRILALDGTLRSLSDRHVVMGDAGKLPNPGFCLASRSG